MQWSLAETRESQRQCAKGPKRKIESTYACTHVRTNAETLQRLVKLCRAPADFWRRTTRERAQAPALYLSRDVLMASLNLNKASSPCHGMALHGMAKPSVRRSSSGVHMPCSPTVYVVRLRSARAAFRCCNEHRSRRQGSTSHGISWVLRSLPARAIPSLICDSRRCDQSRWEESEQNRDGERPSRCYFQRWALGLRGRSGVVFVEIPRPDREDPL